MAYAGVVAVSVLVSVAVYVVSLREQSSVAAWLGFTSNEQLDTVSAPVQPEMPASEHVTYVPLAVAGRTPLRTRLAGLLGIIVLVFFSAAILALGLYQAGHLVNQTIAKFFGKG